MTAPGIGLHPLLSRATYESIAAANFSSLRLFERSAAHVLEARTHPKAPTPAMELGTHAHAAILEPARFEAEYVVAPECDRRTTIGKRAWAEFEAASGSQTILREKDWEWVTALRDAVWAHPLAARLLGGPGSCELAAVWKHDRTGLACKGLIDRVGQTDDGWTWVIDVKTARDAGARAFAREAAGYQYHAQAAFYLSGLNAIAPAKRRFAWVVVEKEPPYAVAVYEPDSAALDAGEQACERWLDAWQRCHETGEWPGYGVEIQSLELPRWAVAEVYE